MMRHGETAAASLVLGDVKGMVVQDVRTTPEGATVLTFRRHGGRTPYHVLLTLGTRATVLTDGCKVLRDLDAALAASRSLPYADWVEGQRA